MTVRRTACALATVAAVELAGRAVVLAPGAGSAPQEVHFDATAYCLRGRTRDGGHVRPGVVAADLRLLPLGSIIEVHRDRLTPWGIMHGRYDGFYVVTDIGPKVVGHVIDVWMEDCQDAGAFGRQPVTVRRWR